ncbi:MAG: hypothetical protein ACP5OS_03355 [Leptospirillia bacterium]
MAARDSRRGQDDPVKVPHRNQIGIEKRKGDFSKTRKKQKDPEDEVSKRGIKSGFPDFCPKKDAPGLDLLSMRTKTSTFFREPGSESEERNRQGSLPGKVPRGSCFSYALAKASGEPLLIKGEDFGRTDIGSAL